MIITDCLILLFLWVEYVVLMADVLLDLSLYTFIGGELLIVEVFEVRYCCQLAGVDHADECWLNWVVRYDDELIGYV